MLGSRVISNSCIESSVCWIVKQLVYTRTGSSNLLYTTAGALLSIARRCYAGIDAVEEKSLDQVETKRSLSQ